MTLNQIGWTFTDRTYTDSQEFNQQVAAYQKSNYQTEQRWLPDQIVFDFPLLQIQYMAWICSPSELLENETLIEDDQHVFEQYPEEEQHQVEILARLKADNGKDFTALEFLIKAHNQQANKHLGDHVFFEGTDQSPQIIGGLPTCYIACGS